MSQHNYHPPVSSLLEVGQPAAFGNDRSWPDYPLRYGLTAEHIPELLRMACDPELNTADSASDEVWAPLHAARALGQLKAVETASELLALLNTFCEDDWYREDLKYILARMGGAVLPAVRHFLSRSAGDIFSRAAVTSALTELARHDLSCYPACLSLLVEQIEWNEAECSGENRALYNSLLISDLLDLNAVETLPLIRRLFAEDRVDHFVVSWDSVQREFGISEPDPSPENPFSSCPYFFKERPIFFEQNWQRQTAPLSPREIKRREQKKKKRERNLKNRARKLMQRKRR